MRALVASWIVAHFEGPPGEALIPALMWDAGLTGLISVYPRRRSPVVCVIAYENLQRVYDESRAALNKYK